jgi:hypothetical protein
MLLTKGIQHTLVYSRVREIALVSQENNGDILPVGELDLCVDFSLPLRNENVCVVCARERKESLEEAIRRRFYVRT